MSDFWRIQVNEKPAPVTLTSIPDSTGAMLINSPKGLEEPQKITRGSTNEILRRFGYPSTSYPKIQEAIDFNKDSDLWITSPSVSANGLYGGVLVTTSGSVPFTKGIPDIDLFDFAAVPYVEEIGVGDDATTNFVDVLTNYVNNSLTKIIVGSTEISVSVTDAEPEVITGTGISSGTLTRATDTIDITFSVAPALGEKIYAVYSSDQSTNTYYAIFSKSFNSLNDESIFTTYNTALSQFNWDFYIDNEKGDAIIVESYIGSIVPGTFDTQGRNIYLETLYEDNPYFQIKVNTNTFTTFTDDTALVEFAGGERDTNLTSTEYTIGWNYFQDKEKYKAKLFMDVIGDSSIPDLFVTLRTTYQKQATYLLPFPEATDSATAITTKDGYAIDNSGLRFFWNWGYREEIYTKTKFWSPLIGGVGVKYAEIVRGAFGGLAPAWINENGLGGQLPFDVIKMKFNALESTTQALDTAGINAIKQYETYRVVITSHKTAQEPNIKTDFSYSSHRMLADYHIEKIVNDVLVQQQTKTNDNYHRSKVKAGADKIIAETQTVGQTQLLSEFITKCDEENNDANVKNARKFVLDVAVKYNPSSEFIIFNYITTEQGISVEEKIGG